MSAQLGDSSADNTAISNVWRNKIFALETVAVTAAESPGLGLKLERKQRWFCHSSSVKAAERKENQGCAHITHARRLEYLRCIQE